MTIDRRMVLIGHLDDEGHEPGHCLCPLFLILVLLDPGFGRTRDHRRVLRDDVCERGAQTREKRINPREDESGKYISCDDRHPEYDPITQKGIALTINQDLGGPWTL